ncbi:MAG: DUF2279 domain-containing protein [Campylobacterota bacterium]|nr:DUF2279 domain-containing protein [Campylobacterota bacterium]
MKKIISSLLLTVSLMAGDAVQTKVEDPAVQTNFEKFTLKSETTLTDEELKKRVLHTNLVGAGVVTVWGIAFWDYFTISPVWGDEGWFEEDTKYGGADKFGHLYSTYLWSLGFSSLYEYWGMSEDDAMIYGPLTSWLFQGMMELGDSFSKSQGFSYEDMIMNTLGAAFYYVREKYPSVKDKLDLRIEYLPDFKGEDDIFTQYNSMKYLVALKFSGFESMDSNLLKYGELQLGYYTRGYQNHEAYSQKERVAYVGVGINVSEVLAAMGWIKTSKIFNYYQMPYTYVPFGHDYDSNSYVAPYSRPYHGSMK